VDTNSGGNIPSFSDESAAIAECFQANPNATDGERIIVILLEDKKHHSGGGSGYCGWLKGELEKLLALTRAQERERIASLISGMTLFPIDPGTLANLIRENKRVPSRGSIEGL